MPSICGKRTDSLTGIISPQRDGALASLKLKHVDPVQRRLDQDAREVKTKFSKTFSTWFFPVQSDALRIFREWVGHLHGDLLWCDDDPLLEGSTDGRNPDRS